MTTRSRHVFFFWLAAPRRYMAPEALSRGRYSEKSDVWAFGVLAWELLTCGYIPYHSIADDDRVIAHVLGGGRLERPQACRGSSYNQLWAVVCSCWTQSPKQRPTFAQLGVSLGQLGSPSAAGQGLPPPAPSGMLVTTQGKPCRARYRAGWPPHAKPPPPRERSACSPQSARQSKHPADGLLFFSPISSMLPKPQRLQRRTSSCCGRRAAW